MIKNLILLIGIVIALSFSISAQQVEGQFWRTYWYQRGIEFGNPGTEKKVHVNSPDTVLHLNFGKLPEARENGMIQIPISENLRQIIRAELYLEIWGGNPGTANKRVSVNGRNTYPFQEIGTFIKNYTHQYPTVYLQPSDLVNGFNAFQFSCDRGQSLRGHFIVNEAALKIGLRRDHSDLQQAGLMGFNALIKAEAVPGNFEAIRLKLFSSDELMIQSVEYQGFYNGYDENGDSIGYGWHGMTKAKEPYGSIGVSKVAPFSVDWDTAMLPEQQEMAMRAVVTFKDYPNLTFITPVIGGLSIQKPKGRRVQLYSSRNLPVPFAADANQKKSCTIDLDVEASSIERAELNLVSWNDGIETGKNSFTINGHPIEISDQSKGEVLFSRIAIDPKILKRGANQLELSTETEGRGLEILLPGPALMIRSK